MVDSMSLVLITILSLCMPVFSFIAYAFLQQLFRQSPSARHVFARRTFRIRWSLIGGGLMGLVYLTGAIQPWLFEQVSISPLGTLMGMLITAMLCAASGYLGFSVAARVFASRE
jgi:hypothetical protein